MTYAVLQAAAGFGAVTPQPCVAINGASVCYTDDLRNVDPAAVHTMLKSLGLYKGDMNQAVTAGPTVDAITAFLAWWDSKGHPIVFSHGDDPMTNSIWSPLVTGELIKAYQLYPTGSGAGKSPISTLAPHVLEPPTYAAPPSSSSGGGPVGGLSTTTLLIIGAAVVGGIFLLKKKFKPNARRGRRPRRRARGGRGRVIRYRGHLVGRRRAPRKYRKLGAVRAGQYAWPKGYMYPVHDAKHTRAASARFAKWKRRYPKHMRRVIAKRIDAAKQRFHIGQYR